MQLKLLVFAQLRDRLGFGERVVDYSTGESPRTIVARVAPGLDLSTLRVAVDCEYQDWDAPLSGATELALIPPVSGG